MKIHKEQHNILKILEEHVYKCIDDRSKVIYVNNGINNTKLDTIKATIIYSDYYRGNYDVIQYK